MKKFLILFSLIPSYAIGQPIVPPIPIHGHPQLKEYTDESQFPTIAGHMNWGPGENPVTPSVPGGTFDIVAGTLGNRQLGHGHMSVIKCPQYAEIKGPITCKFQFLLFNVLATIAFNPQFQDGIRDIKWDLTGTTPPVMTGAMGEERVWNGTFVIDPTIAKLFPTKHGWWNPNFNAEFRFANGDVINKVVYSSFYVMIDPSAPETGVPFISIRVSPHSARTDEQWGEQDVETLRDTKQYLPLAPISAPYTFRVNTGGYGATGLPPAISEIRVDSDIHHHMGGKVIQEIVQPKTHEINAVFDPVSLGPGNHKVVIGRRQIGLSGIEAIVTQLVFDVKVGGVTPPVTITTPNVVGLTKTAAVSALMAVGITVDTNAITTANSSTVAKDLVISQNPAAMAVVSPGSSAALVISLGPIATPPVTDTSGTYTFVCDALGNCKKTFVPR